MGLATGFPPFKALGHLQARHRLLQKHNVLIFPGKYLQPKPTKKNTSSPLGLGKQDLDIIGEGRNTQGKWGPVHVTSIENHCRAELQIFVNEPQIVAICQATGSLLDDLSNPGLLQTSLILLVQLHDDVL